MATRFWVPQPISAIANNGSGPCRCTVSSTTGMTTGDTCFFYGVTGTPLLIGNQTITVIDATHIDIAAIAFVATGTGNCNGLWNGANTNNWVTTTGGTNYGQTVPGSADTVTLDGNSGTGTVTVASSIGGTNTIASVTATAFTGTFDLSVNNPTLTISGSLGMDFSSAASKTVKFGSSTINFANGGSLILTSATGTVTCGAATFNHSSTSLTAQQGIFPGIFGANFSSATFVFNGRATGVGVTLNTSAFSVAALTINGPNFISPPSSVTDTIGTLTITGTLSAPVYFGSNSTQNGQVGPLVVTTAAISYAVLRGCNFTGSAGAISASNSWDFGNNTLLGGSISPPSGGGGVIGS